MIITYLRSSSYSTHSMCEQQYFIEYNLGLRSPSNQKADLGTIVHKVMEILADISVAAAKGEMFIHDEMCGEINTIDHNVEKITEQVYEYYTSRFTHHQWKPLNLKHCKQWVEKAITIQNGNFDPRNQKIIQPEQHFDIEIKKPWAYYDYGDDLKGYLAIKGTIDLIAQPNPNTIEIIDYKGLPLETPIPTPNGWSTMGSINVGDIVYDRFGKQTSVVAKSKIKNKECYKITFDDTSIAECDDEHYWTLQDNSVVQAPDLQIGMKIDVAMPIENEDVELPIDPYLLGVWLGDGRNRGGEISCGDFEVFDKIRSLGRELGVDQEKQKRTLQTRTVYQLTAELRKLNLLHNKHIPDVYFRASYNQRMELLKGLMDTDGSVNPLRKQCVFMNRNKRLSYDLKHLLLTLGQRPQVVRTFQTYKDQRIDCYPVFFRPINIVPFCIERKANKIDLSWGPGVSNTRKIKKIEKIGVKKTQCISVDSSDKTYLCTENFIPTHNTGKRLDWASGEIKTFKKLEKDPQLRMYHYAASKLYPDIDHVIVSIYFINDGGIFSMNYDKSQLPETEDMIRKKFQDIKACTRPRLSKTWKCTKLCHFGKNYFPDAEIEYRDGQRTPHGLPMTMCEELKYSIDLLGMKGTVDKYQKEGYNVGKYKAPGSVE